MKKRKVGIFGGSFDPIHIGHLNLAISLKEACHLDEVIFVPAQLSPFKEKNPPKASGAHRLKMVELALSSLPGCSVIDEELQRPPPSYTIDTVRKLAEDTSRELHLLIHASLVESFLSWKEAEELIRLAPPFIGSSSFKAIAWGKVIPIPSFEVSSTLIRKRLAKKLYCEHLLTPLVLNYIQEHELYHG